VNRKDFMLQFPSLPLDARRAVPLATGLLPAAQEGGSAGKERRWA
jgi:hypothetical protein